MINNLLLIFKIHNNNKEEKINYYLNLKKMLHQVTIHPKNLVLIKQYK